MMMNNFLSFRFLTTLSLAFFCQNKVIASTDSQQLLYASPPVQWLIPPKFKVYAKDFQSMLNNRLVADIQVDTTGRIFDVKFKHASGDTKVDNIIRRSLTIAKFKPYVENGVATPFYATQPIVIVTRDDSDLTHCPYRFNSQNWLNQIYGKPTPFYYLKRPLLALPYSALEGQNRKIGFEFSISPDGKAKDLRITQSSGLPELDKLIIQAMSTAQLEHTEETLSSPINSIYEDNIVFNVAACTPVLLSIE